MRKTLLLLTSSLCLTMNSFAQQIDSTFTTNGYIPYLGPNSNSNGNLGASNAVAIQPDGKIVTVMTGDLNASSDLWMYTYRYMPDGMPDATFGDNGVSKNFCGQTSIGYDVEIQADGKIVLIGESKYCTNGICGASQFIMMRLNTDGTLDTTFGNNGHILTSDVFGSNGLYSIPKSLHILPNGQFMVGGRGPSQKPAIVRLNSNGFPDPTYGTNGVYSLTTIPNSQFVDMAISANGTAYGLVSSHTWDQATMTYDSANFSENVLFKLNPNGTPDLTFGTNGVFTFSTDNTDKPFSIALTSTNRLLVAGYNMPENTYYTPLDFGGDGQINKGFVAFVNTNGSLDLSVPNGFSAFDLADSATFFNHIIEKSPTEYLVCGYTTDYQAGNFQNKGLIVSINNQGQLNTNFNGTGFMIFDHGTLGTSGWNGKIANFTDVDVVDNKILLSGSRNPIGGATKSSIYLLRLNYGPASGLGFDDLPAENDFTCFPNPATENSLNIDLAESGTIQICSIDGRILYQDELLQGISEVQVTLGYKGMAIVRFQSTEGKTATQKILFQ